MQEIDPTRRTALKALALLGVGATGSTGVAAAHGGDTSQDDQSDAFYVAHLTPQPDVDSNAHGVAAVQKRHEALKFVLYVVNLENATMAHIH